MTQEFGPAQRRSRRLRSGPETGAVVRGELRDHPRLHGMGLARAKIDVQILGGRLQDTAVDACLAAAFGQRVFRKIPRRIIVAKHVKTAKAGRKPDGGEMRRGEARRHGQSRKQLSIGAQN